MNKKTVINRRQMLRSAGMATAAVVAAPKKIDIEGLDHPKRMFDLTEGLIRRKYSDAEIEGILGGNFERVLTQIWTV